VKDDDSLYRRMRRVAAGEAAYAIDTLVVRTIPVWVAWNSVSVAFEKMNAIPAVSSDDVRDSGMTCSPLGEWLRAPCVHRGVR